MGLGIAKPKETGCTFSFIFNFLLARSLRSLACLSLDLKVSLLVIPSLRSVIF